MVLGKKKKKGNSFQVEYIVSILEIKPWPPSVALCSVQTVLIQWENGDQNSGFLPPGVPSLNGFDDGKIEFNEFFKLTVTLTGKNDNDFQKNYLEFHLYEPKKDKAVKGQLLGTAVINLAEYGIIRDVQTVTTPIIITKKVSKGTTQPLLYVQIQPFDNEGIESVLRMMSEQQFDDNDSEFNSVTDDDEGTSNFSRALSLQPKNSSFRVDEMINFVNVGLNSDLVGAAEKVEDNVKDEGMRRKSTESKEHEQSGEDEWGLGRSAESNNVFGKFSEVATTRKQTSRSISTLKFGKKGLDLHGLGDKLKHIKSVKISSDSPRATCPVPLQQLIDKAKEESSVKEVQVDTKSQEKRSKKDKKNVVEADDSRLEFESKIKMLEEELREAAALEIGLYSVVAEHLNSKRKVHAPARRLSRFYRHVCKTESQTNRASSARTVVSGLVMASKACGNDVSRLTFWLSNTIILRAMVSQITEEILLLTEPISTETKTKKKKPEKKSSLNESMENLGDWEDPQTFIKALEKVEAWIFFRIVEGLWWQSFAPHMQPTKKKKVKRLTTRKTQKWQFGLGDQEQGHYSIELWKKAFQDACERLCPIRAGGHDCGCLPMLSKLVMEQLVDRLDVAMLNAILRDSDEDMPTDPMSDPISEPKVLPIPAGKSSFGAGAQLKNAVGSWSKWLSDFFGLEEDESPKDQDDESDEDDDFKAFRLLKALGDLMMLPLGMLSDATTRKEVCPIFGGPLIKRVFINFIPDEFSPDPITEEVLEALATEDPHETSEDCIKTIPCGAKPVAYAPLPAALFSGLLGESSNQAQKKNGSSLLRKSHNSDDELDKLNVPLASINLQNICIEPDSSKPNWMPKGKGGRDVVRYQLLQEAWRSGT
ncbi:Myosin-H heavy chain [Bienertia sinuspersici]